MVQRLKNIDITNLTDFFILELYVEKNKTTSIIMFMKKTFKFITLFILCLLSLVVFSGYIKRKSLSNLLKKYPKEMVKTFFKEGILKVKNFNKDNLEYLTYNQENKITYENKVLINPLLNAESQNHNECGGMSSAYVMRFYKNNVTGLSVYSQIKNKNPDGTINPNQLYQYLKTQSDYNIYACKGTIQDLKTVLDCNIPVIVLINCTGGFHYVPVVGYDNEYIYIQDSVPSFRNSKQTSYNRRETYKDFEKLWNVVLPKSDHLMYIITKK